MADSGRRSDQGNRDRRHSDPVLSYWPDDLHLTPEEKDAFMAFLSEMKAELMRRNKHTRVEPEVPKPELGKKLKVSGIDLHVDENIKVHHTEEYHCTEPQKVDDITIPAQLIVRRGQQFKMTIKFDRPYKARVNDATLIFTLGSAAGGRKKLTRTMKLIETKPDKVKKNKWSAHVEKQEETSLTVSVNVPAKCEVGEWKLSVKTIVDREGGKDLIWQYMHPHSVIVLFNPWCPDDGVYVKDPDWLKEAVLNEHGCVYVGGVEYNHPKDWFFGQFRDGMVDISLHLLGKAFKNNSTSQLGYPQRVVRALSAIVNSNDDYQGFGGVLQGNWSGNYGDGVNPSKWSGSVSILEKYAKEKKPVKYGQCWVFSGVLTTVCRALGIPCRSVTNFESAHNTDELYLSCDVINRKNSKGVWVEDSDDSVWNFHVWNEVWMTRPDLNPQDKHQYGGWQAIDATPQETSDGVFRCGPSPLKAIKEGELNVGSDTAFIFAECNGDKVEWLLHPKTEKWYQMSRVNDAIGKNMSTHEPTGKPLKNGYKDKEVLIVTDLYKYPEGSKKEREIVRKAEKIFRSSGSDDEDDDYTPPPVVDLETKFDIPRDCPVGKSVPIKLTAENKGRKAKTVILSVDIESVDYRNKNPQPVASKKSGRITLNPLDKKDITFDLDVDSTLKFPENGFIFNALGVMEVEDLDGFPYKATKKIFMEPPNIDITGPETCKLGETIEVVLKLTNPLKKPLTNCKLSFEGNLDPADGSKEMTIGTIPANGTWSQKLKLRPTETPRGIIWRSVYLTLSTEELGALNGHHYLTLNKN